MNRKPLSYSLVLPCWNECGALEYLFREYGPLAQTRSLEVIFVDNGSTDGTAARYQELAQRHPDFAAHFRYAHEPVNKGVGGGLKAGARIAQGEKLIFCHADEQYGRAAVEAVIQEDLKSGTDGPRLIKGLRRGRSLRENLISRGFDAATLALRGRAFYDINAQPKCFPRPAPRFWDHAPDDYCIDVFLLLNLRRRGCRIRSVAVPVQERASGASSWSRSWKSVLRLSHRYVSFLIGA